MKAKRTILLRLLASMALLVVVAIACWRFDQPLPSQGPGAAASQEATPSAGQLPDREQSVESDSLPPSPTATIAMEAPRTLFLRALAATLESIQSGSIALEREQKLESLVNDIRMADLPAALEFLKERSSSELSGDLSLRLVRRWAEGDPRAAAGWATQMQTGPARQETLDAVAIGWANQNISDAVEWVRQLASDEEQHSGLMTVAYEAARTEPIEAIKLAVELPANEVRDDLITHTASQWAASDPQAAAAWANQITDAALRERVLAQIATAWGDTDPVAAATLASRSLTAGKQQDDAIVSIVQRWVQQEPVETAAWVTEFPQGPLRDTALQELVKLWADQDLERAANWLTGLLPGSSRDIAVGAYVSKIALIFPELAAQWAEDIGDDTLRYREIETVGEAWMGRDPAAARFWIVHASLPEITKLRLLSSKPQ